MPADDEARAAINRLEDRVNALEERTFVRLVVLDLFKRDGQFRREVTQLISEELAQETLRQTPR
jgi:hypothetical protein